MLDARLSGCINHPTIEAANRCKQCGRPVCKSCTVTGPTGKFCSDNCKEKHQAFVERARDLEQKSRKGAGLGKLRHVLIRLVIFLVAIGALGGAAIYFNVPVVATIARRVWALLSAYVPGI